MNCDSCKSHSTTNVPYIVHESSMARMERTIKRLWILLILMAFFLVGTNMAWIIYENQFEDVVTTQEVTQHTTDGDNNFAGGDLIGNAEGKNNN